MPPSPQDAAARQRTLGSAPLLLASGMCLAVHFGA